jgi:hypothetical protein
MQINPQVPFISEARVEELANDLLDQYNWEIEPIFGPPIPVERIADFLLELNLEWLNIPDTEEEPILAYLDPPSKTIRFNEQRLPYFEQHPGTYEYTLAHEIGHYQLHLLNGTVQADEVYVYRHQQATKNRREWQAEKFASYLLMPVSLLMPAIKGLDLHCWSTLYRLRDLFQVSITALRIRLEEMGYLYLAPNGQLYPSLSAATADLRQESRRLIGQGQLHINTGNTALALEAYQQALNIAQALGNRREEALLSWQLGLLYAETDPARAVELMSVCVAYERDIGHPEAEVDAERVAHLKTL